MPRAPRPAAAAAAMPAAVFSPVAHRPPPERVFPLHVGDTWMEPCPAARMESLATAEHPGMHRYCATRGIAPLVEALVEKVRARNGLPCDPDTLLVSGGATAGLAAAVGALVDPGEEVLILAPFWPLIRGIVQALRATPVEVPFFDRVHSPEAAAEAVRERVGERTVALYVSTPSNPTGRVLAEPWLAALAEEARRHDLWILSDEVYEDYVYRGAHVSLGTLAPERTLSVFSFSKAYGMAGNRVGYLVGPGEAVAQAHKLGVHTVYHAPTASQWAALAALREGAQWVRDAREAYRRAGDDAARVLGVEAPAGSMFLFLDASRVLDERGVDGLLEDCFEDGVLVAPGASSGEAYGDWVRLCYSSAPPDEVAEGVRRLARRLGREA
jgi:N-succinyldiaminopimelate aminotransferase